MTLLILTLITLVCGVGWIRAELRRDRDQARIEAWRRVAARTRLKAAKALGGARELNQRRKYDANRHDQEIDELVAEVARLQA